MVVLVTDVVEEIIKLFVCSGMEIIVNTYWTKYLIKSYGIWATFIVKISPNGRDLCYSIPYWDHNYTSWQKWFFICSHIWTKVYKLVYKVKSNLPTAIWNPSRGMSILVITCMYFFSLLFTDRLISADSNSIALKLAVTSRWVHSNMSMSSVNTSNWTLVQDILPLKLSPLNTLHNEIAEIPI